MTVLSQILEKKIIAILRGIDPVHALPIAKALHKGGIGILEITLNSPGALPLIEELCHHFGDGLLVGAGTVLDPTAAKAAVSHGARFIISPIVDLPTIETTRQLGAVSIPGAFTPTEILTAFRNGGEIIKVFPAADPSYIRDVRAPLPHIPLMPTGGIDSGNIGEFQKAGAVAFGIGSALVSAKEKITDSFLDQLTERARKFCQAIQQTEN